MSERSANVILGAAIIDDILGILPAIIFDLFNFGKWISMHNVDKRRFVIGAFCNIMFFSRAIFFDITGAFVGISFISNVSYI